MTRRVCSAPGDVVTATAPPLTERQFQAQVTELAEMLGWQWVHFRPAETGRGWRTPVSGTLGKGWVDLILVRERDRRLLFVELKAEKGKATPEQERTMEVLAELTWVRQEHPGKSTSGPEVIVFVWRPSDWPEIERVLR